MTTNNINILHSEHHLDLSPAYTERFNFPLTYQPVYRNLNYVIGQVKQLAEQLAERRPVEPAEELT